MPRPCSNVMMWGQVCWRLRPLRSAVRKYWQYLKEWQDPIRITIQIQEFLPPRRGGGTRCIEVTLPIRLTVNGENQLSGRLNVVGGGARVDGGVIGHRDTRDHQTRPDTCSPRPHTYSTLSL